MLREIIMPQLSSTMTAGTVNKWLKKEGEYVKKGELIVEIETDKVNMEAESFESGFLVKIVAQEGDEVPVAQVIAYVADKQDEMPPSLPGKPLQPAVAVETRVAEAPSMVSVPGGSRSNASPVARKLATDAGIDLATIQGSGPGGRIDKGDVLTAIENKGRKQAAPAIPQTVSPSASKAPAVAEVIPLTGMRKIIAERLAESFRNAPHIVVTMNIDMYQAQILRDNLVARMSDAWGVKISPTDLIIKATALALKQHSALNASLANEQITVYKDINIGLAVALAKGLIVPTLRNADALSLPEIAKMREDLVTKARAGALSLEEVSGGTFTVSNLGMYGVSSFSAIINPPQVAILAVAGISERPVARAGQVVIRPEMNVSLSTDHRAVDGAQAAEFLKTLKDLLENPFLTLLPG